jgi:hypothetical protein
LTSAEVAGVAGISLRQLQVWEEERVAVAGRQGRFRIYNLEQALFVVVLAELRQRGMSFQKLRHLAPQIRLTLNEWRAWELGQNRRLFLLTTGTKVYVADDPNKTCDLVSNIFKPLLCVNLALCQERVRNQCLRPNEE